MGRESKANPTSEENVGRYNARIIVVYNNLDKQTETYDPITWIHQGDYLALNLAANHLKLICMRAVKCVDITTRPTEKIEVV